MSSATRVGGLVAGGGRGPGCRARGRRRGKFAKGAARGRNEGKNARWVIEGEPKAADVSGSRAFGARPRDALERAGKRQAILSRSTQAEVAVRLMPLLSGEVAIETLEAFPAQGEYRAAKRTARLNFSDLQGPRTRTRSRGTAEPADRRGAPREAAACYRGEASERTESDRREREDPAGLDGQSPGDVSPVGEGLRAEAEGRPQGAGLGPPCASTLGKEDSPSTNSARR